MPWQLTPNTPIYKDYILNVLKKMILVTFLFQDISMKRKADFSVWEMLADHLSIILRLFQVWFFPLLGNYLNIFSPKLFIRSICTGRM